MGGSTSYAETIVRTIDERDDRLHSSMFEVIKSLQATNLTQEDIAGLVRNDVASLVQMLNKRKITSEAIVAALSMRAGTIGLNLHLITEDNFKVALAMAKQCDAHRKESQKNNWVIGNQWDMDKYLPPLFGIPISVKDNISVKGLVVTIGCSSWAGNRSSEDNLLVKCFMNSGMIPFVKSNMPQCGMTIETVNHLFGRSQNPYNKAKAVGGSSGGQAGLIAAGCSVLGVGNDIGGSIRVPSDFCGLFGFKPSFNRLSHKFCDQYTRSLTGLQTIKVSTGPLSTSVDALALWMKVVCSEEFYKGGYDKYHVLTPFNQKQYTLSQQPTLKRIGYLTSLDFAQASPTCVRAVKECSQILKGLGYELVPITIPNETEIIRSFLLYLAGQGNLRTSTEMLAGEQLIDEYKLFETSVKVNNVLRRCIGGCLKMFKPRLAYLLEASRECSTYEFITNSGDIIFYREEWIKYWEANRLDYVMMPTFPGYALTHGTSKDLMTFAAYTFIWNVLDMTAGSLPVTLVRPEEQVYVSRNNDPLTNSMRQSNRDGEGLPVGVQIIGLPFEDEKVLGLMKILEDKIGFYAKYGRPEVK